MFFNKKGRNFEIKSLLFFLSIKRRDRLVEKKMTNSLRIKTVMDLALSSTPMGTFHLIFSFKGTHFDHKL